ncbi:hypothetical protein ARSEF1564_010348 [Beauveria bassiana]
MSSNGLLGPTGKSYAFDSRAEGYGRGEGVATIILKRLDDAIRSNDPIRGVIRATATGQDGKTNTITSPNQGAQEEVMRTCYRKVGLSPTETFYFEAHGTGTQIGDVTEARAISAVFTVGNEKETGDEQTLLRVGSIKANIGHTEAVSGLASIIKTILVLEKATIPRTANFEKPNQQLDLISLGIKVR